VFLGEAKTPDGMRIYAIGDVHGMDAMLAAAHLRVAEDLAARPVGDHRIVHIGDYVDRGPHSAAVIERLSTLSGTDPRVICLAGNHDRMMIDFLADPVPNADAWFQNGAASTIVTYGIDASGVRTVGEAIVVADDLKRAMPERHHDFLGRLRLSAQLGDFYFCHAGIRPGVALDRQTTFDLVWIRETFLHDRRDHGVVVVHGHTPVDAPEVRRNRVGIDTGAVFGGPLTIAIFEGTDLQFLEIWRGGDNV
jgi:serine/threonine protein phosphatase 1